MARTEMETDSKRRCITFTVFIIIVGEILIKTTMSYHLIPMRMPMNKTKMIITGKAWRKGHSCILLEGM